MSDQLTTTEATEYLDRMGALDAARAPGCYCLRLADPPDDPESVADAWLETPGNKVVPKHGFADRLADAGRLLYVGSHGKSVYARICQHCKGEKSATIMDVWPVVAIEAVWPGDDSDAGEYNHAVEMADEETACWMDGSLL